MTKNVSNLFHKVLELEESQVVLVFNAQLFEHLLVLLDSGRETRPRVTKTNVLKTVGPAPPL